MSNILTMTSKRFSKYQRVLKNREYREIYNSSQRGGSAHFNYHILVYRQQRSRIGITVSKKVSKNAVDRNRIKRQVKEFYRLHQDQLTVGAVVITAKPSCGRANDIDRYASLEHLWQKVLKWQSWHLRNNNEIEQ